MCHNRYLLSSVTFTTTIDPPSGVDTVKEAREHLAILTEMCKNFRTKKKYHPDMHQIKQIERTKKSWTKNFIVHPERLALSQ